MVEPPLTARNGRRDASRQVLGYILLVLWLAAFFAPFGLLYWAFSGGGHRVSAWTGWPWWIGGSAAIAGAAIVSAAWTVVIWPLLFRSSDSLRSKSVVMMPAAAVMAVVWSTKQSWGRLVLRGVFASDAGKRPVSPPREATTPEITPPASEGSFARETAVDGQMSVKPDAALAEHPSGGRDVARDLELTVPEPPEPNSDDVWGVNAEALALADAGDHTGACRAAARLRRFSPMTLAGPGTGCGWYGLEASADKSTDRDAARFVYELCIAHEEWAMHFATASGEAMSAKVAIGKLRAKM